MSTTKFDKTRLARVHTAMHGYIERGEVPGLVALICRHDELFVDAMGSTALAGKHAVERNTIFRISSMTKPVTAVATLMLLEEGKLRLDEPVDRLLPELAQRKVLKRFDGPVSDTEPARRPISVRDLLTFRMGFGQTIAPTPTPLMQLAIERQIGMGPPSPQALPAPDAWLQRLGSLPLMYQPGERWLYNTGSDVLGVLVARASGQPFDVFLRERIFEPLAMHDTGFSVPATELDRFVTSYMVNANRGELELYDRPDGQWSRPPAFPSGAGGLVSTADDFLAFSRMLLNGGRHERTRLLSRAAIELMTTDQLTAQQKAVSGFFPDTFESQGWGFGVSVVTRRTDFASIGSFGWDGGLGTSWRIDPKLGLITILLTQRAWTSPRPPAVNADFWTAAYQALDE